MNQFMYGFLLFIIMALPPVSNLLESIMILHMHMQMPLLVIAGIFMARFFQVKFPNFFKKWNENGIPGILLFIIIMSYWMLPRAMDEALTVQMIQVFKFISLPFLAGVPLRDSWPKLSSVWKNGVIIFFTIMFFVMGWLYVKSPDPLCNNYLLIEQITLGWGFITMAICMVIYLTYIAFINPSDYE
ncbi:hypothetical protein LGQ02_11125 [Bacillus shivajii]|uniref:hypothetical protein n=1 Tax=Bacillus shivajii TaxID=1983719 RepID=UPI001CFA4303|nr:hypothetical protein [Bacillus shivajii]UCZ51431.1 hypothetical protein LGQ02_11125 [Bacillus shivajii]